MKDQFETIPQVNSSGCDDRGAVGIVGDSSGVVTRRSVVGSTGGRVQRRAVVGDTGGVVGQCPSIERSTSELHR